MVLDTNVWLDWLVFNDASVVALKAAQAAQRIEIVRDQPGELELERVLAYKAIKPLVQAALKPAILEELRRVSCLHAGAAQPGRLPQCRDPDDQKFLELARDCGASLLVTKDRDLLSLRRAKFALSGFRIVKPQECDSWLAAHSQNANSPNAHSPNAPAPNAPSPNATASLAQLA